MIAFTRKTDYALLSLAALAAALLDSIIDVVSCSVDLASASKSATPLVQHRAVVRLSAGQLSARMRNSCPMKGEPMFAQVSDCTRKASVRFI